MNLFKRYLALFFLKVIEVDSWVVLASHSTQLALASTWDRRSLKMITTGAQFRGQYNDITMAGSSDTDCYVSVGDVRGFDRVLFEAPQMCVSFSVIPGDDESESSASNLPQGVVTGMQGNQAMVAGVNYFGDYTEVVMVNPINMPYGFFPAAVSADPLGGVYVGLHDTNGVVPPAAPDDATELVNIYEYVKKMREPKLAAGGSPLVTKVNVTNGQVLWEVALKTEGGHSTIGNIRYMSARDLLVVVGSSNGQGTTVGGEGSSQDWDAYVTLIEGSTGNIDDIAANRTQLTAEPSKRIASQTGKDDFGTGLCVTDDQIFVLGSTTGKIDGDKEGGGFVIAMDADSLEILWKRQFVGNGVTTLKCVAFSGLIYVAGTVPAGVMVVDTTRSTDDPSDTQDLFVSLLSADTGDVQWIRQIDSRRDDMVNDIFVASLGYAMLLGNAMDFENDRNEIFVMTLSQKDGYNDWEELPGDVDPLAIYSSSSPWDEADGVCKVAGVVPAGVITFVLAIIAFV